MPNSAYDWQAGFFGLNYPRLQSIRAAYDPQGLFTKPLVPLAPGQAEVEVPPARVLAEALLAEQASAAAPSPAPAASAAAPRAAARLAQVAAAAGLLLLLA